VLLDLIGNGVERVRPLFSTARLPHRIRALRGLHAGVKLRTGRIGDAGDLLSRGRIKGRQDCGRIDDAPIDGHGVVPIEIDHFRSSAIDVYRLT